MSYLLPKRISELASIDSDDLETPDKRTVKNNYRLPKRTADLTFQESDSEDDKNDKLNCAILNDSFIHSPSKKFDYDNTPQQKSKCKEDENNPNAQNKEQFNSESSVDSGNHSKSNHLSDEGPPTVVDENPLKISYRPIKARTQLFATKSASSLEPSIPSVFQKSHHKVLSPAEDVRSGHQHEDTPKLIESLSLKTVDIETPFKKVDPHMFATPSLRLQSFCAPTAKKSINLPLQPRTCERKEKPQAKILFTTPSARPPPGSLLESTPIEMRKPPLMNLRKLSPIKEPSTEKEKTDEKVITINNIDYIIDHKIGSGGSSTVFLARAKKSNSECAIKLVKLDGDQQVIDGYLNETKQLEKLQGNVCVVKLLDYCHLRDRGILYVVMEKGESDLHKILQGFKTHIPLYTLMSYWYQMLQAVNYIHLNGVIHSDLKPANFLMIDGRLKLIDFGIASNIAIDSTSIIKFSQAGTFNYISPEALIDTSNGDSPSTHHQPKIRLSTKSDVWSLGCIFYLLLYKKTPFSHIKVIHHKITALTSPRTVIEYPELPNFYPPLLVEMVKKCLIYNPKERSSVADLLKNPFEMIISIEK